MSTNTTRTGFQQSGRRKNYGSLLPRVGIALFAVALMITASSLFAQTAAPAAVPALPPALPPALLQGVPDYLIQGEAPTSLFQTKIGDAGVDLLATGSWQTDAALSLSLGIHPSLGNGAGYEWWYPFPWPTIGATGLFYLDSKVDVTVSLWILQRYFFETTFIDQFALNTFLFGYQGHGNEFVQKILIGNTLMPFSQYPYLPIGGIDYAATDGAITAGDLLGTTPEPAAVIQAATSYTGVANTLALAALFRTDTTRHELLLKFENNALTRQSYLGTDEIVRTHINPGSYVNGQYFVLPDSNIDNLQIYVEDPAGTITVSNAAGGGKSTFTQVDPSQVAVYSLADGTIFFRKPMTTRVLVTYTKGGVRIGTSTALGRNAAYNLTSNVPDPSQPVGFSWDAATDSAFNQLVKDTGYVDGTPDVHYTVNGADCLLLWQPGYYSPFALADQYDITSEINNPSAVGSTVSTDALIVSRNSNSAYSLNPARQAVVVPADYRISVVDPASSNIRDASNRYPFSALSPTSYSALYGLAPETSPSYTPFDILLEQKIARTAVTIDTNAVPGTVRITMNGQEISSFTVDYSSGVVSFPFPVLATDDIEISYQTANNGSSGGQLVFGSGNTILLANNLLLDIAVGARWSILGGGYSTQADQAPGSIVASTRLAYKSPNVQATIAAGVSVSTPDTSGTLLLAGMGDDNTAIQVDASRLLPSTLPAELNDFATAISPQSSLIALGLTLTQTNRGELFYVDYGENILGGIQLQPYNWNAVPQNQIYPYSSGSRIGPYAAGGGTDGPAGQVMALDYSLTAGKPWVSGDLAVPSGSDLDLSTAKGIAVTWKATASAETGTSDGTVRVFLQIGALGEDRDGNGQLDVGTSTATPGFPFHDSSNGFTLLAGGPPWSPIIHTEDTNGNGVLDAEESSHVVTMELTTVDNTGSTYAAPPASFQRREFLFSAAQQAALRDVRGVRIVVVDTGGTNADGRVLMGGITIEGTSFTATTTSASGTVTVRATNESQLGPAKTLVTAFPETSPMLSGTVDQPILLADWSGFAPTDTWSAVHYTTPVPDNEYGALVFYVAPTTTIAPVSGNAKLTVHYDAGSTPGITATVPLPAAVSPPVWHKVVVNLSSHQVTIDGNATSGSVTFSAIGNDLTRLEIDGSNMTAGSLAIDQISLTSPLAQWGAGVQASGTVSAPGVLLHAGSVTILKDATLSASGYARSPGFVSLAGQANSEYAGVSLKGQATVLSAQVSANFSVDGGIGNPATAGGHSITIPVGGSVASITDTFQRGYSDVQPLLYRLDSVSVHIPSALGINLSTQATFPGTLSGSGNSGTLSQQWTTTINSEWGGPLSVQTGLALVDNSLFSLSANEPYPVAWVDSFRYALPYSADPAAQRSATSTMNLTYTSPFVVPTLTLLANYQTPYAISGSSGTSQINQQLSEAKATLSVPFTLVPPNATQPGIAAGLTLTPSYTRDMHVAITPAAGWASLIGAQSADPSSVMDFRMFGGDFMNYGQSVWSQQYFFAAAPIADIFDPSLVNWFSTLSSGTAYADYAPSVALALSRSVGSSPWDFIVPNQLQVSFGRELQRQANAVSDQSTASITLTNAAINVFGRLGAYPLFSFYRSEDYSSSIDMTFTTATTQSGLTWSLYHILSSTLYLTDTNTIALNNRFSVSVQPAVLVSDDGTITYAWRTHPKNLLGIGVLNAALAAGAYLVHTETLTADWSQGATGSNLTLTIGHQTAFTLSKNGEVGLFGKFGVNISPYSTTDATLGNVLALAVQIGISGKLKF